MDNILPYSQPKMTRADAETVLRAIGCRDGHAILSVRGYYLRTMGDPARNDRGIYDDAIAVVLPESFATYNANTDPSRYRKATAERKGMAVLAPGIYKYTLGIHGLSKPKAQQYQAMVQAGEVKVIRDGGMIDVGYFGINIHHGGETTTSSEGCQTIPPGRQFEQFMQVMRSIIPGRQKWIHYCLVTVEDYEHHLAVAAINGGTK
jgi:hypothetical protein